MTRKTNIILGGVSLTILAIAYVRKQQRIHTTPEQHNINVKRARGEHSHSTGINKGVINGFKEPMRPVSDFTQASTLQQLYNIIPLMRNESHTTSAVSTVVQKRSTLC